MNIQLFGPNRQNCEFAIVYKDLKIEKTIIDGILTKILYITVPQESKVENEWYLITETDEYIVKECKTTSGKYKSIVAKMSVDGLEGTPILNYEKVNATLHDCMTEALAGSGWSFSLIESIEKKRSFQETKTNAFAMVKKICSAFLCEAEINTLTKQIKLKEKLGENRKTRLINRFNVKELKVSGDSYDFYTRIIPIGKDGITIEDVNYGRNYVENFGYSRKVKTLIWEDTNYDNAQSLKEDAEYKVNEMSRPKKSYSFKIYDIAKMNEKYERDFTVDIGDIVCLYDQETGIREEQRVMKMTEYPDEPYKNDCEIANRMLSFEEMQKKMFAAADTVGNITNGNIVIGGNVRGMKASQISGLEIYSVEALTNKDIENICK